jgi:hypothetical protein
MEKYYKHKLLSQTNMTDYKALYEAQLEENKKLKQHLKDVMEDGRKLIISMAEETQSKLDEMYEFSYFKKLKKAEEEIKKLKEENKFLLNSKNELWKEAEELTQKIEKLKEENKQL